MKIHRISHTHLQFARANAIPKIAKEYVLPTLKSERKQDRLCTTLCISNGGQSAKYERIMNKMNGSAIMKVSANKPATTHTRYRCVS